MVATEVEDAANDAEDGTKLWVTASIEANNFPTDTILLVGEGERDEGGAFEFGVRSRQQVKTPLTDEKLHIGEPERSGVGFCSGVFTGTEEEEEGKGNHVGHSQVAVGRGCEGNKHDVLNDGDGHRFDAIGRRVFSTVGAELTLDAKVYVALRVLARIVGPQTSERLANAP